MYIEWFETFFAALSFLLVALSVYLWRRAAMVPSFPDQSTLTLARQSRLHARAGFVGKLRSALFGPPDDCPSNRGHYGRLIAGACTMVRTVLVRPHAET